MQRRIIVIFLLLIFIYNLTGYYFAFIVQQYQIKKEVKIQIKNSLPENKLIVLSFHPLSDEYNKIKWIEDNEFKYNGQMYDVIRRLTDADGTIHYYCINDKQEEELFANLDEHIKNHVSNNETTKNNGKDTLKKIIKEYVSNYFCFSFTSFYKDIAFAYLHPSVIKKADDILTPPS